MSKIEGYNPTPGSKVQSRIPKRMRGGELKGPPDPTKANPQKDYDVDLSSRSKELGKNLKSAESSSTTSSLAPDTPSLPDLPDVTDTFAKEAAKEAGKEAIKKATKIERKEYGDLEEPGVFFISGLELFDIGSSDGDHDGMPAMAANSDYGQIYNWDQKEEIIDAIHARKMNQPLILVGHSLGGDTAMEIADELNSADNKFRTVDLVITLDSVGYDNDTVPENVRANFNFTSDTSWMDIFSDGPNIAKNYEKTFVQNFLTEEGHTELDDAPDIQKMILSAVNQTTYSAHKQI